MSGTRSPLRATDAARARSISPGSVSGTLSPLLVLTAADRDQIQDDLDRHKEWQSLHGWTDGPGSAANRREILRLEQMLNTDGWLGVYPGMCVNPDTCRGLGHCPRDYSCSE